MLIAVFSVALLVRLIFYAQLSDTPFGRNAFLDADYYDAWAQRIAAGEWLGGPTPFFVEPGYLYLLAIGKWLGVDPFGIRLLQAFVGAGTAVLAARLAQRFAGAGAALLAGLGVALYATLVHFEGLLLKTTLEVFCSTLALVLAVSERPRPLMLGLAAGLALSLKSNFALMVPVLVVWSAWRERRTPVRRWLAPVYVILGVAPLLVAVAARNHVVSGEALLLPWSSGINFYIGNGPEADGLDPTLSFAHVGPGGEGLAGKREAERRADRSMGYAESSQFWWDESWRHIAAQPSAWIGLLSDKARLFLHHYEFTDNVSFYFVRERVSILRWLLVGYWLVVPLAFVGVLGAALTRDPGRGLLAAFLILQAAGVVGFHVIERYRLALVPCAMALGVVALFELPRRTIGERSALGAIAALGLASSLLTPPIGATGQNMAGQHRLLAIDAMARADYLEAERELRRASASNPRIPHYHFRLSLARRMLGDEAGAERAAAAGIRLEPERGRLKLAAILLELQPAEAARVCLESAGLGLRAIESLLCAAEALRHSDELGRAEQVLVGGLEHAPRALALWIELGDVRLALGDEKGARRAWQRARRLAPDSPQLDERLGRDAGEGSSS